MYVAQEHSIYGSSRVGVDGRKDTLYMGAVYTPTWGGANTSRRALGLKSFELSNHLGNVLVTVSDKPIYKVSSGSVYFNPEITSASDYYPFGAPINGRSFSSTEYRFGFNGKEGDNESETQDYGMRIYNRRLGRFLSVDPKAAYAPGWSPYRAFYCNPIRYTDPDGQWEWDAKGNLVAQKGDNSYSMAKFLGTNQSNAMQMLNRGGVTANAKGVLNLKEGHSFAQSSLWVGTKSASGPVVKNSAEATAHYYLGNGAAADVGDQSTRELLGSSKFRALHTKITSEQVQAKGNFSVNMVGSTFHIGNTYVDYSVSGNGKSSSVTYKLFAKDGFWDPDFVDENIDEFVRDKIGYSPFGKSLIPDQKGPNLERGGTPYDYKTRERIFFFKPVQVTPIGPDQLPWNIDTEKK
jgi:RHS repeat-associated protein